MTHCYYCERNDDLERQIAGFWFCFWCLPRALAKGSHYWTQLYASLYPWR